MSNVELATITEAQADGTTAAIFADIRETMGVALVNLIWRHLAVSPAALNWSWQSLKPLYMSGAVPQAAWTLRQALAVPEFPAFGEQERLDAQCSVSDFVLVDAVLRTYERGNAQNLVALCALRLRLTGTAAGDTGATSEQDPPLAPRANDIQAERADRVTEALPPLPAMTDLSTAIRSDIESLAEVWVPAQHRGMIPSVFRHLAHWPALLAAFRSRVQTLPPDSTSMAALAVDAIGEATRHAAPLVAQLDTPAPLDAATRDWLSDALDLFIDGMIGRGVVLVPAMRRML